MEKTGRNPIPLDLLEERRNFELELAKSGLSRMTIVKKVNELDVTKHWGTITLRTLQRDICTIYGDSEGYTPGAEMFEARAMRSLHIAQLENTAELLRLEIAERDKIGNWSKGERTKAISALFKMQRDIGLAQGFHASRMLNPLNPFDLSSEPNTLNIYENTQRSFQEMDPDSQNLLIEALNIAIERKSKDEDGNSAD